jgi:hypothetical protein
VPGVQPPACTVGTSCSGGVQRVWPVSHASPATQDSPRVPASLAESPPKQLAKSLSGQVCPPTLSPLSAALGRAWLEITLSWPAVGFRASVTSFLWNLSLGCAEAVLGPCPHGGGGRSSAGWRAALSTNWSPAENREKSIAELSLRSKGQSPSAKGPRHQVK